MWMRGSRACGFEALSRSYCRGLTNWTRVWVRVGVYYTIRNPQNSIGNYLGLYFTGTDELLDSQPGGKRLAAERQLDLLRDT